MEVMEENMAEEVDMDQEQMDILVEEDSIQQPIIMVAELDLELMVEVALHLEAIIVELPVYVLSSIGLLNL